MKSQEFIEQKASILKNHHHHQHQHSKSSSYESASREDSNQEGDHSDSNLSEISLDLHSYTSDDYSYHHQRHVSFQLENDEEVKEDAQQNRSEKDHHYRPPSLNDLASKNVDTNTRDYPTFSPPRLVLLEEHEEDIRPVLSSPSPQAIQSSRSGSQTQNQLSASPKKHSLRYNNYQQPAIRQQQEFHPPNTGTTAASPSSSPSSSFTEPSNRLRNHSASSPNLHSSFLMNNNPVTTSSFILNTSMTNEEESGAMLTSSMMDDYMMTTTPQKVVPKPPPMAMPEKASPPPLLSSKSNLFEKLSSFKSNLQSKSLTSRNDLQELPQVPQEEDEEDGFLNDIILSTPSSGSKHHQHHVHFNGPTIPYLPNSHLPPVSPISSKTNNWIELKIKMDEMANSGTSQSHATEMFLAAQEGDIELLKSLIDVKKVNVNAKDKEGYGQTALHYGCWFGNLKVVELLISRKADINAVNDVSALRVNNFSPF